MQLEVYEVFNYCFVNWGIEMGCCDRCVLEL